MDKQVLKGYLNQGLTHREISGLMKKGKSTIGYWVKQHELEDYQKYKKPKYKDVNYFKKIDTKEKAYILGFLLGDGCLTDDNICISIALDDKPILDFISSELGCNITISTNLNKSKKQYPNAKFNICNKQIIKHLKMLFGGNKKEDRHIPIISPKYERYLLQGFFDAEGCITWGKRKDRNRIWQKVSFTSQYKMLEGIQNILYKQQIPSKLKPKSDNSNCYIIEFASKASVLNFLDIIYPNNDFIILNRKYNNAQALRLELGEFGET